MVPAQFSHPVPQQEGFAGGQDHVFAPRRLLPRIRRSVKLTHYFFLFNTFFPPVEMMMH